MRFLVSKSPWIVAFQSWHLWKLKKTIEMHFYVCNMSSIFILSLQIYIYIQSLSNFKIKSCYAFNDANVLLFSIKKIPKTFKIKTTLEAFETPIIKILIHHLSFEDTHFHFILFFVLGGFTFHVLIFLFRWSKSFIGYSFLCEVYFHLSKF